MLEMWFLSPISFVLITLTFTGCGRVGYEYLTTPETGTETCIAEECEGKEFLIAGFLFNQINSVTDAVVVEGNLEVDMSSADRFAKTLVDFESFRSVGNLLGYGTDDRAYFVPFPAQNGNFPEPNTQRVSIELSWSPGIVAVNRPGDDLVLFESGSPGGSEPFGIRVRATSESQFSGMRYEFPDRFDNTEEVFATGIDFSDFGVPEGGLVDALQVSNIYNSEASAHGTGPDRVSDPSGQGNLLRFGDPGYESGFPLLTGPNAVEPATDKLDTDIVYAVALHPLVNTTN